MPWIQDDCSVIYTNTFLVLDFETIADCLKSGSKLVNFKIPWECQDS